MTLPPRIRFHGWHTQENVASVTEEMDKTAKGAEQLRKEAAILQAALSANDEADKAAAVVEEARNSLPLEAKLGHALDVDNLSQQDLLLKWDPRKRGQLHAWLAVNTSWRSFVALYRAPPVTSFLCCGQVL
jgi:hypothetical protein